jgi:hypothetical protein
MYGTIHMTSLYTAAKFIRERERERERDDLTDIVGVKALLELTEMVREGN